MKNKPVKKPRTPRTIADLKFDWEITDTNNSSSTIDSNILKIEELNPDLKKYKIKNGFYKFRFENEEIELLIDKWGKRVAELFEYLGYRICGLGINGKFSHFEQIDDSTYRIHMKK